MARYGCNTAVLVIGSGIYAFEQFIVDKTYFGNPAAQPKPYVVLNRWDFVKLADALGVHSAQSVNSAAGLDSALANAKASHAPALIHAQVSPHNLPAELP